MPALVLLDDEVTRLSELLTQHVEPAQLRSLALGRLAIDLDVVADGRTGVDIARALIEQCQEARRSEQLLMLILQEMAPPKELLKWITETYAPAAAAAANSPLHKLLHTAHPTQDFFVYLERMQLRGRHVCRIEIDDEAKGTGLLVGADQVLTAYHVVKDLVNGGQQTPGSHNSLKFRFDYFRLKNGETNDGTVIKAAADWLGPHLMDHPEDGQVLEPGEPPACLDRLDYALLRLSEPVGNAPRRATGGEVRGWTELIEDPALVTLVPNMDIYIGHHPDGIPLQANGGIIDWVNATRSRVRYRASATYGSSGAPCFNNRLEVVAMHHARINGHPLNQGIPITSIKQDIQRRGLQLERASDGFAPVWKLANNHPVFGRDEFQQCVWEVKAAVDSPTILAVTGAGRSFCADILRAQLGASNLLLSYDFAHLSIRNLPSLLDLLATDLGLSKQSIPRPPDDRQSSRWASTDAPNWFVAEFQQRLDRGSAEHNQAWIIVDNYERHEFVDEDARDFIVTLLRSPERLPRLRWLLLGREPSAAVIESSMFVTVNLEEITREQVAIYMQRYCRAKGITPRQDSIDGILDLVFGEALAHAAPKALLSWRAKAVERFQAALVS